MNQRLPGFLLLAGCMTVCALAQESAPAPTAKSATAVQESMSISALRGQSLTALQNGDKKTAIQAADAMIRLYPDDVRSMRRAADIYLRTGKVEMAVRLFDRYLESVVLSNRTPL